MRIKTKRRKRIDIAESGALSDLAFLLIIFFIVIAVFTINTGFVLGLPRKDSAKIVNVDDILKITLRENGTFEYKNDTITTTDLQTMISRRLAVRPNMTLFLTIHPMTPYQSVVNIIEFVRMNEVENFSFRMLEEQ